MSSPVLQALAMFVALIIGGGLVIGVSRTTTISLQDKAIKARDRTIDDLQKQINQLKTDLGQLEGRVKHLIGDVVDKDSAITILVQKNRGLEATIKRYDAARAICPHADCPMERRTHRKPKVVKGSTP